MALLDYSPLWLPLVPVTFLVLFFPDSDVNELPVHTIVLAFSLCGIVLCVLHNRAGILLQHAKESQQYTSVPLEESSIKESSQIASAYPQAKRNGLSRFAIGSIILLASSALTLRVELYRRISKATECTIRTPEAFLPLLISIYDCFRYQNSMANGNSSQLDHALGSITRRYLLHSRWRCIPSVLLLSSGCYLITHLWDATNSTYICPIVVGEANIIPAMQVLALFLDAFMAIILLELLQALQKTSGQNYTKFSLVVASVLFVVSLIWCLIGIILYFAKPWERRWLVPHELIFRPSFLLKVIVQSTVLSAAFITTLSSVSQFGLLPTALNLTAVCFLIPGVTFLWSSVGVFLVASFSAKIVSFVLVFLGWSSFQYAQAHYSPAPHWSLLRWALLFAVYLLLIYPGWRSPLTFEIHPIDLLLDDATLQHQLYRIEASKSHTIQDAVVEYKRRYSTRPPPGFDLWYEYAQNRSAIIVDEFDQIYEDLLPFRAVSPAQLRRQTWEMVSNPWNDISGITIREGVASVQENVIPTHRWMLEGVAILINSFARHLPDMDLAFNLNDESRVAVPYDDMRTLRERAKSTNLSGHDTWSTNRAEGWLPVSPEPYHESAFIDLAFRNIFTQFGSVGCSPTSLARSHQHLASQSHVCYACAAPHSEGQFLANWTLAADVCHQPDLGRLHGLYLSPAAFKASHQLMPVFSQSKPHGFNDILYPSAWNYMDKAVYAPIEPSGEFDTDTYQPGFPDEEFKFKRNTLFWRGATSEGVSSGEHSWRGMTRQRLVHMTNNLTSSQHDHVTLLLPESSSEGAVLSYQTLPGNSIKNLGLSTDIAIVDHIARCGGIGLHDCTDQEQEFALVQPTDFQAHWKYRYLFDLDGAGFSGRFLPFLQSKCLPFKTALFREWYDSRLTAWVHFVPQDLRLHGVWSTLAYFAGVDGTVQGKKYFMEPHLKEGEAIAMAGREWAGKVLRKEDMELYFFRLLLEWARLTDDRRDELGFSI